jgi:hypothetical protein
LGLVNLAASLHAGLNIWLNYSLSLERPGLVYAVVAVLCWQGLGMFLLGRDNLLHMALVMVSAGVLANIAGFAMTWYIVPRPRAAFASS